MPEVCDVTVPPQVLPLVCFGGKIMGCLNNNMDSTISPIITQKFIQKENIFKKMWYTIVIPIFSTNAIIGVIFQPVFLCYMITFRQYRFFCKLRHFYDNIDIFYTGCFVLKILTVLYTIPIFATININIVFLYEL